MTFLRSPRRRHRHDGWTDDRIVTFFVTLAATGSVTFAAAAAGLSRKSAYARRSSDPAFAASWTQALAAAQAARLDAGRSRGPGGRKGDEADKVDNPPESLSKGDARDLVRRIAEAERNGFFAGLEMRLPAAFRGRRLGPPLAKRRKPSNGDRFAKRA